MTRGPRFLWVDVLAHGVFLTLVALSIQYWQERVVYADSALQFFEWIQYDDLVVQQGYRWSAVVPQLIVKALRSLGLRIDQLAIAASLAYALWPYAMFLLTRYWIRSRIAAWAMAMGMVLFSRHGFYEMVLETQLLAVYPVMLFGWIERVRPGGPFVGLVLVGLSLFLHPLGPVAVLCVLALCQAKRMISLRMLCTGIGVVVAWLCIRHTMISVSAYEAGLYEVLFSSEGLPNLSSLPQVENYIDHVGRRSTVYLVGSILALVVAVTLVFRQAWWHSLVFVGVLISYFMLLALTYRDGETALMIEKNLIFLGAWISIWAIDLRIFGSTERTSYWALVAFASVAFLKVRDVSLAGSMYSNRLKALHEVLNESSPVSSKVIVERSYVNAKGIWVEWALPFESILLSALHGECITTVICADEIPNNAVRDGTVLILPYTAKVLHPEDLDNRYFHCDHRPYRDLLDGGIALPKMNDPTFRLPSGPYVRLSQER